MKKKYNCYSCKAENIVDITDFLIAGGSGLGSSGLLATEIGTSGLLSSSDFLNQFFPSNSTNNLQHFRHICKSCGKENMRPL